MTSFVLDNCVAVKWFVPASGETHTEEAAELMRRYLDRRIGLMVPDLFWAEFANTLWKLARQGRWSKRAAEQALAQMQAYNLPTMPSRRLVDEAMAIAGRYGCSVYDGFYVALAKLSRMPLITADEKLVRNLGAHVPIKWLGAM